MRLILTLLTALLALPVAAQPAVVAGRVVDGRGDGLPLVNVAVVGTVEGGVTDGDGHFAFVTAQTGRQTLRATLLGFEPAEAAVDLVPGDTARVTLRLLEALVELGEIAVEASAFSSGEADAATLKPIEVLTTPGAAADVYRAMQTFPGVTTLDEGAGLFVRGGDPSETAVLLDGALLYHPYRYESPTGGVFGSIPPFFLKGTAFSTGAFSARHGNALSGVLALESLDEPQRNALTASAGLAGAALGLDARLLDGRLGVRFSGNRSATGLMFDVNGLADDFVEPPAGGDANLSVTLRTGEVGRVKLFNYVSGSRVGAREPQPSFDGVFRADERSDLHVLHAENALAGWWLEGSLALSHFDARSRFGNLDLTTTDAALGLRLDADRAASDRLEIAVGVEARRLGRRLGGTVPAYGGVLDPEAQALTLDERFGATQAGGYVQAEARLTRRLFANAGLRLDGHSLAGSVVLDPRAALRLQLSKHASTRLAGGRYSQFPVANQFEGDGGNPDLGPQRAWHLVAGAEHQRDRLLLRAEAYHKWYRDLAVRFDAPGAPAGGMWQNAGAGTARGLDLFAKYGAFLETRVDGWASYSLLWSERTQARQRGEAVVAQRGPTPQDVRHHLTLVGKARVWRFLSVGTSLRWASGRPHTPVLDAVRPTGAPSDVPYSLPIEGPVGSERLPAFARADLNASWFQPFGDGHSAVFFASVANVLGRANVLGYDYTADYAGRTEQLTDYDRFFYLGVSVSLTR